jgi:hypothetical protein
MRNSTLTTGLGAIAHQWFEVMRKCGGRNPELLHDCCPVACLGDAPLATLKIFTSHINTRPAPLYLAKTAKPQVEIFSSLDCSEQFSAQMKRN